MLNYNAPISGNYSSIDSRVSPNNPNQMNDFYWLRKAIIETRKDQYFMPLADVTHMP